VAVKLLITKFFIRKFSKWGANAWGSWEIGELGDWEVGELGGFGS